MRINGSLPMPSESGSASSSACSSIRSAKRSGTFLRCAIDARDQAPDSSARRARRTAASTSALSQDDACASSWPVTGL